MMQKKVFKRLLSSSSNGKKYPKPFVSKMKGVGILHDPITNKGMVHPMTERDRLNLRGLIPPRIKSLDEQVEKVLSALRKEESDVRKNLYLQDLHDRNETLAPLIYTPTVGIVCQQFGVDFRRSRGMYFSLMDRGMFSEMCYNWPTDDVRVIVVTDGSRILGLGDLGVHGMGISIGKLALYCAAGGIAPSQVLPIVLDAGTNNTELRESNDYVGTPVPRLEDGPYFDMLDEFVQAIFQRWPNVVLQFEDFETKRANPLLEKYRYKYRVFNDDIQGTGCVTLAGVMSAARNAGISITDMRFVCVGAGSAGLGVCAQLIDGMIRAGLSREEAMSRFVVCTSKGAIGIADGTFGDPNHARGLNNERKQWLNPNISDGADLLTVMKQFKPNCLLGLAAQGGIFTEDVIRAMVQHAPSDKLVIMPMSNPTSRAECTPAQAYEWTNGKAVVATGSPFGPVTFNGTTLTPSQCNNLYIFPGLGLAASIASIRHITDAMLYRAAVACVDSMTPSEIQEGRTFPAIRRIRDVSANVACAVIEEGLKEDLVDLNFISTQKDFRDIFPTATLDKSAVDHDALHAFVLSSMWQPEYHPIVDPDPYFF